VHTVVEVSDHAVRVRPTTSPHGVPRTLIEAALDWIDDPVGLWEERPVAVADLWRRVIAALVGPRTDSIVVVHPSGWPRHRIDRVVAAANAVADRVDAVAHEDWNHEGPDDAGSEPRREVGDDPAPRTHRGRAALLAVAAVLALVGLAVAVGSGPVWRQPSGVVVAEGRMAVRIPEHWTAERVTSGPGSRRLQISSAGDPGIAIHLTWAYAPDTTLAQAADVLSHAIAHEPPGVFVDLRPLDEVAGRPAVTYREVRPGRVVAWSVVLAGPTRISIGCQSPPGREAEVRAACDEAVRSAREA
jgi:type VII secretion-associated protein (TIGR03931 family)